MRAALAFPLCFPFAVLATVFPAGTAIPIRLTAPISTKTAAQGDRVLAVALGVIPGAAIRGIVEAVQAATPASRAQLRLHFGEVLGPSPVSFSARPTMVDNAREQVDDGGNIIGIVQADTISGRLDAGLDRLSEKYAGFASILTAAKGAIFGEADPDIIYDAGVEMELLLEQPLAVDAPAELRPPGFTVPERLAHQPFRTTTQNSARPSDITNLFLIGKEAVLRRAFADAGWSRAEHLNAATEFEAVRAVAEQRGYKDAPVSTLLLEGKPPDLVFEKANNSFARRHHVRIWRRPGTFHGEPIWMAAATHDIAISYSEADRAFIHRIDSQIDSEREKVVADLVFARHVRALQRLARPQVPTAAFNATGDRLETDGRVAAAWLK